MSIIVEELEKIIDEIVTKKVEEQFVETTKDDVREIIESLMPIIDGVVEKRLKEWMVALANSMLDRYKEEEEEVVEIPIKEPEETKESSETTKGEED